MEPSPEFLDLPDARIAFRRSGEGEPLVYLHGSGMTRRWLALTAALSERFEVIAPELPGYGDSTRPRWFRELDDMAIYMSDALTELGLDSFHLAGHSFGANVAASLAALFPERVRSLTLIAPGPLATVTPPELLLPFLRLIEDPNLDSDEVGFNGNQADYPDYLAADDEGTELAPDDGSDPFVDPDAWDQRGAATLYRRLRRISCPRQLVGPDEDRLFPRGCYDLWAEHLDAPIVDIPGERNPTGHFLVVQEPGRVADAIAGLAGRGARVQTDF